MSLGMVESHGTKKQAAEGRVLYEEIRVRCTEAIGREPRLSDVMFAPIPESAL